MNECVPEVSNSDVAAAACLVRFGEFEGDEIWDDFVGELLFDDENTVKISIFDYLLTRQLITYCINSLPLATCQSESDTYFFFFFLNNFLKLKGFGFQGLWFTYCLYSRSMYGLQ